MSNWRVQFDGSFPSSYNEEQVKAWIERKLTEHEKESVRVCNMDEYIDVMETFDIKISRNVEGLKIEVWKLASDGFSVSTCVVVVKRYTWSQVVSCLHIGD